MNTTLQNLPALRSALEHPTRGIVGLVEDLLRLCQERSLELDWQGDTCVVRSLAGGSTETLHKLLRESVFRAVLGRVAALCNEGRPNSVSPYGGQGTLSVGANPATLFHVSFANTTGEQWLKLKS